MNNYSLNAPKIVETILILYNIFYSYTHKRTNVSFEAMFHPVAINVSEESDVSQLMTFVSFNKTYAQMFHGNQLSFQ